MATLLQENQLWLTPFATPMTERAFAWAVDLINTGHTGGVLFAPTRTGKSKLAELLISELREFMGPRGQLVQSATVFVKTWDRKIMPEGGFWRWFLHEVKHPHATKKSLSPTEGRHLVYEYCKGLAGTCPSGRLILIVDEAQVLDLVELGWVADMFNDLSRHGFELIVLLIGSYHLQQWAPRLELKPHEHVRSRFFMKEHELAGLKSIEEFRRCLRRYDVDTQPLGGADSIASYYQPDWTKAGNRLESHAGTFLDAFKQYNQTDLNVPMAYFARTLRTLLNTNCFSLNSDAVSAAVSASGFPKHRA